MIQSLTSIQSKRARKYMIKFLIFITTIIYIMIIKCIYIWELKIITNLINKIFKQMRKILTNLKTAPTTMKITKKNNIDFLLPAK